MAKEPCACWLFLPERLHRIDARSARSGNPRGEQARGDDHDQAPGICDRIGGVHDLGNHGAGGCGEHHRGERGGESGAGDQPVHHRPRGLRQYQLRHLLRRRAQGHPDANLPGALLDEVGQHAEQPRHRQQQRERTEYQRHPERDLQEECFEPRHCPHGHDVAHVQIDHGEAVEERLPGQIRIARDARHDRGLRDLEAGRQKRTGVLDFGDAKARDVS